MARETGLEHLTMLDISPPELVSLAARAGFDAVGLRIAPVTPGEEPWPMDRGSPMLAETVGRCAATGVAVLGVEAVALSPGTAVAQFQPVLEVAGALRARHLNVICDDPEVGRFSDRFAQLVELCRPYRLRPVVEFTRWRPVRTLRQAVAIAAASGGGGLLLDALHVQRCGAGLGELARVEPGLFAYLQACDAPLEQPAGLTLPARLPRGQQAGPGDDAVLEARTMRMLPGEGELPLAGLVSVLPAGLPVSVEAPSLAARQRYGPDEYAARARRALAALLSSAGAS